jgi:protein TonB
MRGLIAALLACIALAMPARAAGQEEARQAALQLYSLRLIQTGAKLKAYPEEAVRQDLTGNAVVSVEIDESGRLLRQTLVKSSGHAILDEHALAMLERAVPQTPVPFGLQNTAFRLLVTVAFVIPPRFQIPFPPSSMAPAGVRA